MNKEFQKELKALLEKYDVCVGFECANSSDLMGVYDEKIVFQANKHPRENLIEIDGYWLTAYDLD